MEEKKEFELRMYFFVPYNISEIQKGIQCGHAALEYARKYGNTKLFKDFVDKWKTWIILNGGTTNSTRDLTSQVFGTLDQIGDTLLENNIPFTFFKEPDLNNAVTSICLIIDERVFNIKEYPDFETCLNDYYTDNIFNLDGIATETEVELEENWIEFIGGEQNRILRDLINGKKLA